MLTASWSLVLSKADWIRSTVGATGSSSKPQSYWTLWWCVPTALEEEIATRMQAEIKMKYKYGQSQEKSSLSGNWRWIQSMKLLCILNDTHRLHSSLLLHCWGSFLRAFQSCGTQRNLATTHQTQAPSCLRKVTGVNYVIKPHPMLTMETCL